MGVKPPWIVQKELNIDAKLKIKALKVEPNYDRIGGFLKRVASETYDKIKWIYDRPVENFCKNVVDRTIEKNVKFHYKLGMVPIIKRTGGSKCCKWCSKLCGIYKYPNEVPKDVYKRHEGCTCTVEYIPRNGKKQNVWTKKYTKQEKRRNIQNKKLTKAEKNAKIKKE